MAGFFPAEFKPKTIYNLRTQFGRDIVFISSLQIFGSPNATNVAFDSVQYPIPTSDAYVIGNLNSSINASKEIKTIFTGCLVFEILCLYPCVKSQNSEVSNKCYLRWFDSMFKAKVPFHVTVGPFLIFISTFFRKYKLDFFQTAVSQNFHLMKVFFDWKIFFYPRINCKMIRSFWWVFLKKIYLNTEAYHCVWLPQQFCQSFFGVKTNSDKKSCINETEKSYIYKIIILWLRE